MEKQWPYVEKMEDFAHKIAGRCPADAVVVKSTKTGELELSDPACREEDNEPWKIEYSFLSSMVDDFPRLAVLLDW